MLAWDKQSLESQPHGGNSPWQSYPEAKPFPGSSLSWRAYTTGLPFSQTSFKLFLIKGHLRLRQQKVGTMWLRQTMSCVLQTLFVFPLAFTLLDFISWSPLSLAMAIEGNLANGMWVEMMWYQHFSHCNVYVNYLEMLKCRFWCSIPVRPSILHF